MGRNSEPQSVESTDEHREETVSVSGRRGFLKKAATVSILGMSGLTAAAATSEPARAAGWSGPYRLYAGESRRFYARWSGEIRIEGRANSSDYTLIAENPYDWQNSLSEAGDGPVGRVEPSDELDTDQEDHAFGEINDKQPYSGKDEPGFADDYYYGNSVLCKATSGVIDVFNKDVIA